MMPLTINTMKKYLQRSLVLILALMLLTCLAACDFDESKNHLSGGELLDDEKMSEIKNDIFSGSLPETFAEETEPSKELASNGDTTSENVVETDKKTDDVNNNENNEQTVYWTKSGSVWHTNPDCHHLKKSTNIQSGTVEEAKEAKKERLCSTCGK